MKKAFFLTTTTVLAILFIGITSFISFKNYKEKNKIYCVGVLKNLEFASINNDNNSHAVSKEFISEIAKRTDLKFKISPMSSNEIIESLKTNKDIELATGIISITPELENSLVFSEPYTSVSPHIIALKHISVFAPNNKKIAYVSGREHNNFSNEYPDSTFVKVDNYDAGVEKILLGEIDYFIMDEFIAKEYLKNISNIHSVQQLPATDKAIVFPKNTDKKIVDKINKAIISMKQDGTIDSLLTKYELFIK